MHTNVKKIVKHKVILAPLSGVSDLSFRLICRELGAPFCFFEMMDARSFMYSHERSMRLARTTEKDIPVAAQLLGADPKYMLDAAEKLTDCTDISLLDVNAACPAKKVIKKKAGAALLNSPKRLGRILKTLSSKLPIPVSVKLRIGFGGRDLREAVKTAKICQENGASIVFLHGRTVSQGYAGSVDYPAIRAVKKALSVPLYGSGDILSASLAKRMFDETGCDGILVARGALGNPWIFKSIQKYLKNGTVARSPTLAVKKRVLKKHLSYIARYKETSPACTLGIMGKIAMWYLKGMPGASRMRERIVRVSSTDELYGLIDGLKG
ncbi:MAG: tRNA dihydrouridine synthase DusB [Candidatus Omnitrophota bacterium]